MNIKFIDFCESNNCGGDAEAACLVYAAKPFHNEVHFQDEIDLPFSNFIEGNGVNMAIVPRHLVEIGIIPFCLIIHMIGERHRSPAAHLVRRTVRRLVGVALCLFRF